MVEFTNPDLEEMWANANMLFLFLATAASDKLVALAAAKKKSTKKKKKKKSQLGHSEDYSGDASDPFQSPDGRNTESTGIDQSY